MVGGPRSGQRSGPPHVSWTSPGACLTNDRLPRPPHSGIFLRWSRFENPVARTTIAKICSLWVAVVTAIFRQMGSGEAIVLGRQDRAGRVESLAQGAVEVRGSAVRLSSLKVSRRTALLEAGIDVHNETRAPLSKIRNLRCRGALPVRPPAVCLPAPQSIEGAHEKNARKCNSGGRVARRSG
jgi:hypothetical protein